MFVRKVRSLLLAIAALALGATSIVACAGASATPGTPVETPLASPTSSVASPTAAPTVLASATPIASLATVTPTSTARPTDSTPTSSSTASPEPTSGEAPPTSVATVGSGGPIRVTPADNGRTIDLQVGQTFLLALGNNLDWNVTVADPTVVSRVVNVLVVRGAQGIYRANRVGQTSLTATGRPICAPNQACPMFIQVVKVELAVH